MAESTRAHARKIARPPRAPSRAAPAPEPDPPAPITTGNQEMLRSLGLHAQLLVSQPSDPDEREADAIADAFAQGAPVAPRVAGRGAAGRVSRACTSCAADDAPLMRSATPGASPAQHAGHRVPALLAASSGTTMSVHERHGFERFFCADLSGIRLHTDAHASHAARSLQARALARGGDVYFDSDEYAPATDKGQRLLAHELTHVLQDGAAGTIRRQERDATSDALDAGAPPPSADAGVGGTPVPMGTGASPNGAVIPTMQGERSTLSPTSPDDPGERAIEIDSMVLSPDTDIARRQLLGQVQRSATVAEGEQAIARVVEVLRFRIPERRTSLSDVSGVSEQRELMAQWVERATAVLPVVEPIVPAIVGDNAQFLRDFQMNLELTLATMLETSQARLDSELRRYGLQVTTTERTRLVVDEGGRRYEPDIVVHHAMATNTATQGMTRAAGELGRQLRTVLRLHAERNTTLGQVPDRQVTGEGHSTVLGVIDQPRHDALTRDIQREQAAYDRMRFEKERDYPILTPFARIEATASIVSMTGTAEGLERLAQGSSAANAETLQAEIDERQRNIRTTWEAFEDGDLNPWRLPPVVAATRGAMDVAADPLHERLVREHTQEVESAAELVEIALGALALGLGLIAAIPSGGSSLIAAGTFAASLGAAATSSYLAAEHLQQYLIDTAASGTDFDKARAVSSADPSLFWLALDIIGAGVDLHAAVTAFRTLSQTVRVALETRAAADIARAQAEIDRVAEQAGESTAARMREEVRGGFGRELAREGATGQQSMREWEGVLNPESHAFIADHPDVRLHYSEMSPRARQALTFCASVCVIPSATPQQAERLEALFRHIPEGDDLHLRQYLHAHADDLDTALARLDNVRSQEQLEHLLGEEFRGASLPPDRNPFEGLTEQEIDAALDEMFSPRVEGGSRPTIDGHRVPVRQRRRFDIQLIAREVGETARAALARVRRVITHTLNENHAVHEAWNRAREAAIREGGALTQANYAELYDRARRYFWREVRGSPEASAYFTQAGFYFPEGNTTAPMLRTGADMPATEIRVSLDHVLEKAQGDNWQLALDASNLRMEFAMPNTYREIIQSRHPELR